MLEPAFRELLLEYLVPMLAGTELGRTRTSGPTHALVAYEHPCALLMKPRKDSAYRVQLVRSQPFTPEEKQLVAFFVEELHQLVQHANAPYFRDLMASLPRRIISKLLPGNRGRSTLGACRRKVHVGCRSSG